MRDRAGVCRKEDVICLPVDKSIFSEPRLIVRNSYRGINYFVVDDRTCVFAYISLKYENRFPSHKIVSMINKDDTQLGEPMVGYVMKSAYMNAGFDIDTDYYMPAIRKTFWKRGGNDHDLTTEEVVTRCKKIIDIYKEMKQ